jgi:hypothetical protein
VAKPIELLGAAHRRLALIAGVRAAAFWIVPALMVIVIAALLGHIGTITWARFGYQLIAFSALRRAILIAGLAMLAVGAVCGWLAWRATGFVEAAGRVDNALQGRQEILTIAALSQQKDSEVEKRSALFSLLRRRVSSRLDSFDPRMFRLRLGDPIRRSSSIVAAAIAIIALMTLSLVRQITPDQAAANKLIELAREIGNTPAGSGPTQEIIAAAERVESSKLPPEQKLQQLADLANQLKQQQPQPKPQDQKQPQSGAHPRNQSANSQTGKSSSGSGTGKGRANNAEGNGGSGEGKGEGPGKGSGNGSNKSTGNDQKSKANANANPKPGEKQKTNEQIAELQDQIAKAQAQIQAEHAKTPGPKTEPGGHDKGSGLKPDKKGDQRLASADQNGKGGNQMNQPGQSGNQKPHGPKPGSNAGNTKGGAQGDTHLGEFPASVAYQRFYQPGEHGPPIAIHDARYVLFRLPEAIMAAPNGGKLMLDANTPHATTPYVNVPLNESHPLEVAPNEQQLVPPRYRDLIR